MIEEEGKLKSRGFTFYFSDLIPVGRAEVLADGFFGLEISGHIPVRYAPTALPTSELLVFLIPSPGSSR